MSELRRDAGKRRGSEWGETNEGVITVMSPLAVLKQGQDSGRQILGLPGGEKGLLGVIHELNSEDGGRFLTAMPRAPSTRQAGCHRQWE